MNNFALGSYEIQNQNSIELEYFFSRGFEYFDMAIDYNNDFCVAPYLKKYKHKIISKIAPCHVNEYSFFVDNHFKCLGIDKIDIMLIHSDRGDWQRLAKLMMNDDRFIEIGVSNFNIEELKEYKEIVGYYPKYNELEVNPFYMDIETINFCKENNIKVIGYEVFGGKYLSERFTTIYGIKNLIDNARKYCDILIIKPTSIYQMDVICNIANNKYLSSDPIPFLDKEKIMQPMVFDAEERFDKLYNGIKIYNNMCPNFELEKIDEFIFQPRFEFLCDYMAYIRYWYGYDEYIGDFLKSNNKYYLVQIFDKDNNLTKVTTCNEIVKITIYKEIKGEKNNG